MGAIRVTVEEQRTVYPNNPKEAEQRTWDLVVTVETSEPKVIAGTLRAYADKIDPPKVTESYR